MPAISNSPQKGAAEETRLADAAADSAPSEDSSLTQRAIEGNFQDFTNAEVPKTSVAQSTLQLVSPQNTLLGQSSVPTITDVGKALLDKTTREELKAILDRAKINATPDSSSVLQIGSIRFDSLTSSPHEQLVQNCSAQCGSAVVIDDFTNRKVDVDGDWREDVSHGEAVEAYIQKHGIPTIQIDVGADGLKLSAVSDGLSETQKKLDAGEDIDAVNLSLGTTLTIDNLRALTGIEELTADNIREYRDQIFDALEKLADKLEQYQAPEQQKNVSGGLSIRNDKIEQYAKQCAKELRGIADCVEKIERLEAQGVDVYIAAGNDPDCINLFGLAKGVDMVGSVDASGNDSSFSARNSLVTRKERGEYDLVETEDGMDITDEGDTDFPDERTTAGKRNNKKSGTDNGDLGGTSFASPTALGKDLSGRSAEGASSEPAAK